MFHSIITNLNKRLFFPKLNNNQRFSLSKLRMFYFNNNLSNKLKEFSNSLNRHSKIYKCNQIYLDSKLNKLDSRIYFRKINFKINRWLIKQISFNNPIIYIYNKTKTRWIWRCIIPSVIILIIVWVPIAIKTWKLIFHMIHVITWKLIIYIDTRR